jgi:hypothetical protein
MPKKIQNFARSALVKPITINVGRAGAASMNVIQVNNFIIFFNIYIIIYIYISGGKTTARGPTLVRYH